MIEHPHRIADAAAGTSVLGWVASWATDALPIIQAFAGLVAIIAGLFAILANMKRLRR